MDEYVECVEERVDGIELFWECKYVTELVKIEMLVRLSD